MFEEIKKELEKGNISRVKELVQSLLDKSFLPKDILEKGLIAGMDIIGDRFKKNEVFIPEVMIAAKAMHEGLSILQPHLIKTGVKPVGRVLIGTVKGDLHDIGKNIVGMMFKGAGFEVIDCGIDVSPETFIKLTKENQTDILAMSSLLTTSMPFMKDVIDLVRAEGLDRDIRTMVGGAPVTQGFADKIGADGYADDASSAVDKARELLGIKNGIIQKTKIHKSHS